MTSLKPNLSDTDISIKRSDFFGLLFNRYVKINYLEIVNVIVIDSSPSVEKAMKGTGAFWNYFPSGLKKNIGEKIFIIERRNRWWKIGFSSDTWADVVLFFKGKGVLVTTR